MPYRYQCPAYEANDDCEDITCVHASDGTQYKFENPMQAFAFAITPVEIQTSFCLLMDMGFDEDTPQD